MTDTSSVSSDRYASSSPPSYDSSIRNPSPIDRRVSSVSQHRPPPLELSTGDTGAELPLRSRSQPAMVTSGHGEPVAAVKPLATPATSSFSHHYRDEEYERNRNRKRAKSIDVEEANRPNIASLSLYTPAVAQGDRLPESICLCAKVPKVPRPRNAFILYRQAWQGHFAAQNPGLANPEISKLIGEKWREQPDGVKNEWKELAEQEKIRHQLQYPGYRYQPRRAGKNNSGGPTSSSGEAPGRCPKCGGRYIATPRTPSTPFGVASPPPLKRPTNMQPFVGADHPRHGSFSAGVKPTDPHARRYTQAQLREIDEDYPMASPVATARPGIPPDTKRRRYNGPPVYVPDSPYAGYAPADPRYQQRLSVSGPPISATGYGPGHASRPSLQHRQGMYTAQPGNPHMQPPPQPSRPLPYQPTTPSRPNNSFDESLRLPPLQTQIHESSPIGPEPTPRQGIPPPPPGQQQQPQAPPGTTALSTSTSTNTMNPVITGQTRQPPPQPHTQPQPHPQHPPSPMPKKWSFMLKLDILRSISPPLRPPTSISAAAGTGAPPFETRGPIIAVEGAPTPILKEVAAVIEKALSVSAEFAVRVWSEDTSGGGIAHSSPEPHATSTGGGGGNNSAEANGNVNAVVEGHGMKDGGDGSGSTGTAVVRGKPSSSSSLISPIASYVARMLKWHKTSEDLVRYVTSYPPPPPQQQASANNTAAPEPSRPQKKRLPIAILSDGYSLTFSDRYAGALHVNDAYRADDHWQWVATLWRGVVGADLTVYVKRVVVVGGDEIQSAGGAGGGGSSVEMAGPGIMVIRLLDGGRVDEKLERRLGFEIAEWVRGGSFAVGFEKT